MWVMGGGEGWWVVREMKEEEGGVMGGGGRYVVRDKEKRVRVCDVGGVGVGKEGRVGLGGD
uniref:hypothetical protein n=1 Tax=Micrococcus luteus TaxID=1270 RepID=UPI0021B2DA41